MKNARSILIVSLAVAFVVGLSAGLASVVLFNTEAPAQAAVARTVQFVKTADVTTPDGANLYERWEDPEYKIVCYVFLVSRQLSCTKK